MLETPNFMSSGKIQNCSISNRKGQFYLPVEHLGCPFRRGVKNLCSLATMNCPYLWQDTSFVHIYFSRRTSWLVSLEISNSFSYRSYTYTWNMWKNFKMAETICGALPLCILSLILKGSDTVLFSLPKFDKIVVVQWMLPGSAQSGIVKQLAWDSCNQGCMQGVTQQ